MESISKSSLGWSLSSVQGAGSPLKTDIVELAGRPQIQATLATGNDPSASKEKLIKAGQQFEAYFIAHMLKVMRETVPEGALANKQGAYFHSFYDQEIGMRAAEAGGVGIARMVQEYAEKYSSRTPQVPADPDR
jgi:flagellar protein FlgJ